MSFWEEIFKWGAQTPGKVEWGRSQGAAACPLQEKAANNKLVIGEIKEKLTSAISMEVVERRSKEAIIPTLRDEVGTRANRAEQWISAAKKKNGSCTAAGVTAGDCIRKKKNGYCLQRDSTLYWASRRSWLQRMQEFLRRWFSGYFRFTANRFQVIKFFGGYGL